MTWQTDIKDNQTSLILVKGTDYNKLAEAVAKKLTGKKVCYVTLNKTASAIKAMLEKKKINAKEFYFIDAISNTITGTTPKLDDCKFISSPGALSELALSISKALSKEYEFIIFDSLTNLLIYQSKAPVAKFISTIINKIRNTKTKGIFYALEMNQHQELIQEANMFVDTTSHFKK